MPWTALTRRSGPRQTEAPCHVASTAAASCWGKSNGGRIWPMERRRNGLSSISKRHGAARFSNLAKHRSLLHMDSELQAAAKYISCAAMWPLDSISLSIIGNSCSLHLVMAKMSEMCF